MAHGEAGGGQPAGPDGDGAGPVVGHPTVVAQADGEPLGGGPGDRHVTAEGDEDATSALAVDPGGDAVGGQGLGGGAEVEDDTLGDAEGGRRHVDLHGAPAGHGPRTRQSAGHARRHPREVAVVADPLHGPADGGVDGPVGGLRGPEGDRHRLEQLVADPYLPSPGPVEPGDLGVGTEPAGQQVHPVELVVQHPRSGHPGVGVGEHQFGDGTERPGAVDGEGAPVGGDRHRAQLPPVRTRAGAWVRTGAVTGGDTVGGVVEGACADGSVDGWVAGVVDGAAGVVPVPAVDDGVEAWPGSARLT